MIDLTRLMFDDGAERAPIGKNVHVPEFPGTLKFIDTITHLGIQYRIYSITSLDENFAFNGWWLNDDSERAVLADAQAYCDHYWSHYKKPGWGDACAVTAERNIRCLYIKEVL